MLPVFVTPSGIPTSLINLGRREGVSDKHNRGLSSTAEAATLQLEFRYLSYLTDNEAYWEAAENVSYLFFWPDSSSYISPLGDESNEEGSCCTWLGAHLHFVGFLYLFACLVRY